MVKETQKQLLIETQQETQLLIKKLPTSHKFFFNLKV